MYEHLWSREDGEEVVIKAAAKLVITAATAAEAGENTGISGSSRNQIFNCTTCKTGFSLPGVYL